MSGWVDVACGAAVWVAGLCAMCAAGALMRVLPSDREGAAAGLAAGIALGMLVAAAWRLAATCSGL